jgi:hypothetical protein
MAKRKSPSFMKPGNSSPCRSLQSDPSLGHLRDTHTHTHTHTHTNVSAPGPVWVPQNITIHLEPKFCF